MEDISKIVEEIKSEFLKIKVDVPHSSIEEQMNLFCLEYKVPISDAKSSVVDYFLKEYNVDKWKFFGANITKLKDLSDKDWVTVKVKVLQLWENTHESISQVGLIGDETGIVKFTKWKGSNIPNIEVGKSYEFNNVVVSEWNEKLQITINKNSIVKEIDEHIVIPNTKLNGINYVLKEGDTDKSEFFGANITKLKDLSDKDWVTVKVKVLQLWENTHESISQVGLIGDETGIVKFTKWKGSNIPDIEVGKSYEFNNVVVSEWNEKLQITINKNSIVKEIDEGITPKTTPKNTINFKGALLHIQSGSGLIKRCLECNRALNKGICSIHGYSDGKYDLRIKAVFDNGKVAHDCVINKELTEKISNISLDDAIELASKTLDMSVVLEQIKQIICGRYYSVTGYMLDGKIIAESIDKC